VLVQLFADFILCGREDPLHPQTIIPSVAKGISIWHDSASRRE
jgi:hypothetical protein